MEIFIDKLKEINSLHAEKIETHYREMLRSHSCSNCQHLQNNRSLHIHASESVSVDDTENIEQGK